jgi:hypothetical protein
VRRVGSILGRSTDGRRVRTAFGFVRRLRWMFLDGWQLTFAIHDSLLELRIL